MNVNFAVTTPEAWATDALNQRSDGIELKTANTSKWATQRTVWARVISSANFGDDSSLRTANILYSGKLDLFENSYESKTNRPQYGLDGLQVSFKGTMGSTRSCTITFKCWSLEQLEILEKLYMVPGISLIAEWGWTLTPSGDRVSPISKFTNYPRERDPYASVMELILENRKNYAGSYDGLIGTITNFNYTLNSNLGFDCEVELVSPGEMWLEQNATNGSKSCDTNENGKQTKHYNLEFIFHDIYAKHNSESDLDLINAQYSPTTVAIIQEWETETREYDKEQRNWYDYDTIKENAASMVGNTLIEHPEVYVSWAYFVKLLNENISLFKEGDEPSKAPLQRDTEPITILGTDLIPVTVLPKFFSLDPRVCTFDPVNINVDNGKSREYDIATADEIEVKVDPTTSEVTEVEPGIFGQIVDWAVDLYQEAAYQVERISNITNNDTTIRECYPTDALPPITGAPALEFAKAQINKLGYATDIKSLAENDSFTLDDGVGLLNNVFLNAGFLRDTVLVAAGDTLTIQDYLSKILGELNIATGNIWNLQFTVDEKRPKVLHIYDANYTSANSRKNQIEYISIFAKMRCLFFSIKVSTQNTTGKSLRWLEKSLNKEHGPLYRQTKEFYFYAEVNRIILIEKLSPFLLS